MILADTSVWIQHLQRRNDRLAALMETREILVHPFVVGELALGHLRSRQTVVSELQLLPQAQVASPIEVLTLIERRQLFGTGIGYVDAHLLAATRLSVGASLWTFDKRLKSAAIRLGISYAAQT